MNRKCTSFVLLPLAWLFALAPAGAAPPASVDRVAANPVAAWEAFLGETSIDAVFGDHSIYDALDGVGYSLSGVDAERCRSGMASLEAAVAVSPVSASLVHAAMMCAEANGDTDGAGHYEAALLALTRQAMGEPVPVLWPRAARVLIPNDAYTLLHLLGIEYRYDWYENIDAGRGYPLAVAGWDPDRKRERQFRFDFINTWSRLRSDDPSWGYPYYKQELVGQRLEFQNKQGALEAIDILAVKGFRGDHGKSAQDGLRAAALQGGINALESWVILCARAPSASCADGLADALVSRAEQRHALPMVMLAFIHAEGIGVKRDGALADRLLDAANGMWTPEDVVVAYLGLAIGSGRMKAIDRAPLRSAMGSPAAQAMRAIAGGAQRESEALSPAVQQALSAPAQNATGIGAYYLAQYWSGKHDQARYDGFLQQAVQAGNADAQASLATDLLQADMVANAPRARDLLRLAADGGSRGAGRYLADMAMMRGDYQVARTWLLPGALSGDLDSLLQLAALFALKDNGLDKTAADAFSIYAALADGSDSIVARRQAAMMALKGEGTSSDPQRAWAWLSESADAGDNQSRMMLAMSAVEGAFGESRTRQGRAQLAKILAKGDAQALSMYGDWLYYQSTRPGARREAVDAWSRAYAKDAESADNNLAWTLCTARDPSMRDPQRGMQVARAILAQPHPVAMKIDTAAACLAASGDYAAAVATQQRAIREVAAYTGATEEQVSNARRDGYADRLALYLKGQPYVDEELGPDGAPAPEHEISKPETQGETGKGAQA